MFFPLMTLREMARVYADPASMLASDAPKTAVEEFLLANDVAEGSEDWTPVIGTA